MEENKKSEDVYDMAIIGSGVVGYGTAMYAGRFHMKTIVIGDAPGGVITTTDVVENYPGFKRLTGIELAEKLKEHAAEYKSVTLLDDRVTNVKKGYDDLFEIMTLGQKRVISKTVVFATGTEWKKLGVPGEKEYANKGVHYCALCDGAFYKGKVVAVIGGGDSSAKDALVMTQWAEVVYIIYRGAKIRPEPVTYDRVLANKKIRLIHDTNVKEIKGDKFVTHVMLDNPYNNSHEFKLDAVFIAIGHIPLSGLAAQLGVKVNAKGEIMIDRDSQTNIPGVYAAGDVVDTRFKQAITGVAEGVKAAYSAYDFIEKTKK
ncbi:MAG: thioredoxin reductase NADPH [archaeon GW2011_AR3]|nr:MAG: thioredoxin reductase NADPH [archaeon GW2011_AR3]MBS3109326.1 FAD-dependent oxidoreductase [Candidatus Woesearchaeota archaeon]